MQTEIRREGIPFFFIHFMQFLWRKLAEFYLYIFRKIPFLTFRKYFLPETYVYIYKFDRTDGRSLSRRVTTRAYLSSRLEACVEFGIHGRESDTFHRVGENGPTFPFGRRRLFTVLLHLERTLLSRLHHQSKGIYPRNIKLRDLMLIKYLCRKMW